MVGFSSSASGSSPRPGAGTPPPCPGCLLQIDGDLVGAPQVVERRFGKTELRLFSKEASARPSARRRGWSSTPFMKCARARRGSISAPLRSARAPLCRFGSRGTRRPAPRAPSSRTPSSFSLRAGAQQGRSPRAPSPDSPARRPARRRRWPCAQRRGGAGAGEEGTRDEDHRETSRSIMGSPSPSARTCPGPLLTPVLDERPDGVRRRPGIPDLGIAPVPRRGRAGSDRGWRSIRSANAWSVS